MSGTLVAAEGLTRIFRKSVVALNNVSFSIPQGSVFGLVGESGSGKSTLARCLLYLDKPTSGSVTYQGVSLGTLSARALRELRSKMQIIFQDPNGALDPRISVFGSLSEGLENAKVRRADREARINELAELVSIPAEHLNRKPRDFSGGQRQRLVIARALSMDPEFLILDEPVSNLDVSIQAQIINLLMDIKRCLNLTYLFISHDLNLVSYVSTIVGVMYAGQLVELGPVDAVLESPLHGYTRNLLASSARLAGERLNAHKSSADTVDIPVGGCTYRDRCDFPSSACAAGVPVLRDVGGGHFIACNHPADLEK